MGGAPSPRPCVGVGVPGLLLHSKRRLGENGTEPGWDVFADVVHLVGVLTGAPRPVFVRLILQDLHAAALATALLTALFLKGMLKISEKCYTSVRYDLSPAACTMKKKKVPQHFHSTASQKGLHPRYFLWAPCHRRTGLTIFRHQTACIHP